MGPQRADARTRRALRRAAEELHAKDAQYRRAVNADFVISLLILLLLALSLRMFIGEPVLVEGESMYPALHSGERIVVEKLTYDVRGPARGDIVVCFYPGHAISRVKRVIGLPGERVAIRNGAVYIDGGLLDERAYWNGFIYGDMEERLVPEHSVFVMGDNRNHSTDSRESSVGCIPYEKILGRAALVFWPPDFARAIRHRARP
ncbi:MAG TPA: signal peptidase I [Feifaniaceae bacterium]|nr:signal peptidase I [Feifaniaceae bacterium]